MQKHVKSIENELNTTSVLTHEINNDGTDGDGHGRMPLHVDVQSCPPNMDVELGPSHTNGQQCPPNVDVQLDLQNADVQSGPSHRNLPSFPRNGTVQPGPSNAGVQPGSLQGHMQPGPSNVDEPPPEITDHTGQLTEVLSDSSEEDVQCREQPEPFRNDFLQQHGQTDGELFDVESDSREERAYEEIRRRNPEEESDQESVRPDSDDDSVSSMENQGEINDEIKSWALNHDINLSALGSLLTILKDRFPTLPTDPRTLLQTSTQYNIQELGGGLYYHFGLQKNLKIKLSANPIFAGQRNQLLIQMNIDGLPVFKSTNDQFWPILGRIEESPCDKPFVIGLFYGKSKPTNVNQYLEQVVEEISTLQTIGFHHNGKQYFVNVSTVVCDAPARSFVKRVKGHSGYYGCDKCITKGAWLKKVTFPELDAPLRTDENFNEMRYDKHHHGVSPFMDVRIGMVTQFPLEYMHLVCLGVVKKLLTLWQRGPLQRRIGSRAVNEISEEMIGLRNFIPREFSRRPRSIKEVDRWKATEFRQFLLYTGPVVLRGKVESVLYKNFLILFVAMHILVNPLYQRYNNYAEELLVEFVQQFGDIYGADQITYNVHGLVHLAKDAQQFGCLDNISAFTFENHMTTLKRMVRKPTNALQQVIRRISEKQEATSENPEAPVLKKEHHNGPLLAENLLCTQYKEVHSKNFTISLLDKDQCVMIGNDIAVVRNILFYDEEIHILYQKFRTLVDFFDYPLNSSTIRVHRASNLREALQVANLNNVQTKCVMLPYRDDYIIIPFAHAI